MFMLTMPFACLLSKSHLSSAGLIHTIWRWLCSSLGYRRSCSEVAVCHFRLLQGSPSLHFQGSFYDPQLRSGLSSGQESWKEKMCAAEACLILWPFENWVLQCKSWFMCFQVSSVRTGLAILASKINVCMDSYIHRAFLSSEPFCISIESYINFIKSKLKWKLCILLHIFFYCFSW